MRCRLILLLLCCYGSGFFVQAQYLAPELNTRLLQLRQEKIDTVTVLEWGSFVPLPITIKGLGKVRFAQSAILFYQRNGQLTAKRILVCYDSVLRGPAAYSSEETVIREDSLTGWLRANQTGLRNDSIRRFVSRKSDTDSSLYYPLHGAHASVYNIDFYWGNEVLKHPVLLFNLEEKEFRSVNLNYEYNRHTLLYQLLLRLQKLVDPVDELFSFQR